MIKLLKPNTISCSWILCLVLVSFLPVHGYASSEEAVYITLDQVQPDITEESGIMTTASEGSDVNAIAISLENSVNKIARINMEICAEDDYLTLAGCDITDRTDGFLCRSWDSGNGCCSVSLFSMNRLSVIEEGTGPIFILRYTPSEELPAGTCTIISTEDPYVTDEGGNEIGVMSSPGEYCFGSVSSSCEITINPETTEVGTGEVVQFEALTTGTGCDNPCYDWQIEGTSGGTIDTSGLYTAGIPGGTDLITVIDDCNREIIDTAEVVIIEDADQDGILDEDDSCLGSDLEDTISIYSCDSGVENLLLDDGCSLNDLIAQCDQQLKIHGMFVSCISLLTNSWKKEGWISWKEKGAVQRCAAQSWRERNQQRPWEEDE
jgi:hypothetical protein